MATAATNNSTENKWTDLERILAPLEFTYEPDELRK